MPKMHLAWPGARHEAYWDDIKEPCQKEHAKAAQPYLF